MLMARRADDSQSTFGSTKETIRPPPSGGRGGVGGRGKRSEDRESV